MRACDLAEGEMVEALIATKAGYARFALNGAAAFAK